MAQSGVKPPHSKTPPSIRLGSDVRPRYVFVPVFAFLRCRRSVLCAPPFPYQATELDCRDTGKRGSGDDISLALAACVAGKVLSSPGKKVPRAAGKVVAEVMS